MSYVVPILASVASVVSAIGSAAMVYKASAATTRVQAQGQSFTQQQDTIDGLREDVAELDNQRRAYYAENVRLLRIIERYRAWGYSLLRLLSDHGVTNLPPEPTEEAIQ